MPIPAIPYSRSLLNDYVVTSRRRPPGTLLSTLLRTRSLAATSLLRHAAESDGVDIKCQLAAAEALVDVTEENLRTGLERYDALLSRYGARRIPRRHQGIHAQLAWSVGEVAWLRRLLRKYRLPADIRASLRANAAHPSWGGDADVWQRRLAEAAGHPTLTVRPGAGSPFDRLQGPRLEPVDGPLISVIVTGFRPDHGLLTAISSLRDQSWRNLEILLVDDASGSEYDAIFDQACAMDQRVRLLRQNTNQGTYAGRNRAFDEARGEFITGLDSDDWAHPARLEHTVAPLVHHPELVATVSRACMLTEELTINRPGREPTTISTASMMIRANSVLPRLGYYDQIRKAADTEYLRRLHATFGHDAIYYLRENWVLMRQAAGSLSRDEFGPGWSHSARHSYKSAYGVWHADIRAGKADPYLPRPTIGQQRPFAVPDHFRYRPSERPTRHFDAIYVLDWRPFGGPQKSTMEEIAALRNAGKRIAVMHLESWRHMTTHQRPLCTPLQRLINSGEVEEVLPTDAATCDLLVLRYPPILQFRQGESSRIRPRHLVILANQAPAEKDGSDQRYVPADCTQAARDLFDTQPLWVPQGPNVREALADHVDLAAFDMPGIIATTQPERNGVRSHLPVVGRHSRDDWSKWPADAETLLAIYPADDDIDVRVMGGVNAVETILGSRAPVNWICYRRDETDVDNFLRQIDFYVYYPHPVQVEAFGRAILEALAAGCVTILPPHFEATFGDAALYRQPGQVRATIEELWGDPDRFRSQSALAQARVREHFSHASYRTLVGNIVEAEVPA